MLYHLWRDETYEKGNFKIYNNNKTIVYDFDAEFEKEIQNVENKIDENAEASVNEILGCNPYSLMVNLIYPRNLLYPKC